MEEVYTVAQVATMLHVNKNYVYELINDGVLPAMKFNSLRVRESSLEQFLKDSEQQFMSSNNPNNLGYQSVTKI